MVANERKCKEDTTIKTTFKQPVTELIKLRHSVRNYKEEALPKELTTKIEDYIASINNPFDKKVEIRLIEKSSQTEDVKLGTYGVIKGANYFFVTACEKDKVSHLALGYSLEKIILYCTSLGLGTVWLGGTFNKSGFAKAISLSEDKTIPIVAPVGYEGGNKSLLGKIFGNNTNRRKEFPEIFFEDSFDTPLRPEHAGNFMEPLEMVRLAPSAVNKQPWRAIKMDDSIHFYTVSKRDINYIDIGIALCHFDLTSKELELEGKFLVQENPLKDSKYNYVISWTKNK